MEPSLSLVRKAYNLYVENLPLVKVQCTDKILTTKILGLYPESEYFKLACSPETADEERIIHVEDLDINSSQMLHILIVLETQGFSATATESEEVLLIKFFNKFGLTTFISLLLKKIRNASVDKIVRILYLYHSLGIPIVEHYDILICNLRQNMGAVWPILLSKQGENPSVDATIYKHICTLEVNDFEHVKLEECSEEEGIDAPPAVVATRRKGGTIGVGGRGFCIVCSKQTTVYCPDPPAGWYCDEHHPYG